MTSSEAKKFEEFLSESFREGVRFRELRLSNDEIEYLRKTYPKISLKKICTTEYTDGKCWYEVRLYS